MTNLPQYQIRPAQAEDFHFCLKTHHNGYKVYITSIWGWDEEKQLKMFKDGFIPEEIKIIVLDNRPIGFYQLNEEKGNIVICDLIIDPQYQGLGIGRSIICLIIEDAKAQGKPVCLGVFKLNQRAMKLYRSLGFEVISENEAHYNMRCKLSRSI